MAIEHIHLQPQNWPSSLNHLTSFVIQFSINNISTKVKVRFSSHVISRNPAIKAGKHPSLLPGTAGMLFRDEGKRPRVWDEQRYQLAKNLPQLIEDALKTNHLIKESTDTNGRKNFLLISPSAPDYHIYFKIFKNTHRATRGYILEINSAYKKTQHSNGNNPRKFADIFNKLHYINKNSLP